MQWFDAGVNLMDPRFDKTTLLEDAYQHHVTHLLIIASDIDESIAAQNFINQASDSKVRLHSTAGVHPHSAQHTNSQTWSQLERLLSEEDICAIGECGLDFNRNFSSPESQIRAFDAQLQLALESKSGVYLHEREAFEQQTKMLSTVCGHLPFLVAHCFTGSSKQMHTYLEMGCFIGVTGWLCDDKRGQSLQNAVKHLPLDKLLLETDAPYLFPKTVRPRAKQNSPKYLRAIAQKVADIKQVPIEEVATAAFNNAIGVFSASTSHEA